jgi:hypothetical protein
MTLRPGSLVAVPSSSSSQSIRPAAQGTLPPGPAYKRTGERLGELLFLIGPGTGRLRSGRSPAARRPRVRQPLVASLERADPPYKHAIRRQDFCNTHRPHRALNQTAPLRTLPDGVPDLDPL